jgi:uncharacterized hydrophobic protein (TIGR00271 family)
VLHLRIVCPSGSTEAVLAMFGDHSGATNVVHHRGVSLEPAGDLVEVDIAREAADDLLDRLRRLQIEQVGTVSVLTVDTALGIRVEEVEREAPGAGVDAVVWDELTELTGQQSALSATFLVFLVIATLIAGVGLLTDSTVLIVGAMVLGPEFGPLAAAAVAVVQRRGRDALWSLRTLLVGFPLAIAVTALGVTLLRLAGEVPPAYLAGHRPLTSFVSSPDVFSVVVALLAGIAGTVSLTSATSTALVGVFISVTTVPAAAEIAAASVTGQGRLAAGAAVQLGVNLGCILIAAVSTLLVQRHAARRRTGQ